MSKAVLWSIGGVFAGAFFSVLGAVFFGGLAIAVVGGGAALLGGGGAANSPFVSQELVLAVLRIAIVLGALTGAVVGYRASDNATAFQSAIEERGYLLARGDRRDFVIVDRAGGIHSLARRIDGMKAADLREFMSTLDRTILPSAEQARTAQIERLGTALWRQYYGDGENKYKWQKPADSNNQAVTAEKYSRGDDYVNQTRAALQEHLKRQAAIDDQPKPLRPEIGDGEIRSDEERIGEIRDAEHDKRRSDRQTKEQGSERKDGEIASDKINAVEITDRMRRLLDRPDEDGNDHADDLAPDRQREAPGGGRTRSR